MEEKALMTDKLRLPEPEKYKDDDFKTSTARVRQARAKLLEDPRAAAAHRKLGEEIAAHLGRKEATLAQVRRAVGLTQVQLAETLSLGQGDISRIEQRANVQLSTLARFIEATGGRLRITAIYGGNEVALKIGDIAPEMSTETARKRPARPRSETALAKRPASAKKAPAKRAALKS
ncbi:MAG: helix-turn-helix domain-containing protein [Acidimicrobiales bacterium]